VPAPGYQGGGGRHADQVSEWVGVDGASSSDTALIQAGVYESPNPANLVGFDVQAWWEILPAAETDITTVAVKAGDTISVTLWELTATTWEINLTDVTNGQSFTTPPEQYSGPGSSAEWVVEADAQCRFRCHLSPLAPYSPAVVFNDLGMTGPEQSLEEITMGPTSPPLQRSPLTVSASPIREGNCLARVWRGPTASSRGRPKSSPGARAGEPEYRGPVLPLPNDWFCPGSCALFVVHSAKSPCRHGTCRAKA
jgi:hypothetical protein